MVWQEISEQFTLCVPLFTPYSVVKFQQLEVTDGGKKYTVTDPVELDRLLSQTDTFIRTCNAEQVRCSVELGKSIEPHL